MILNGPYGMSGAAGTHGEDTTFNYIFCCSVCKKHLGKKCDIKKYR